MQSSSDMFFNSGFYLRGDDGGSGGGGGRLFDVGELSHSAPFHHHEDALLDCSRSSIYNEMRRSNNASIVSPNSMHFGEINTSIGSSETGVVDAGGGFMVERGGRRAAAAASCGGGAVGYGNVENCGDSGTAEHSQQTDDTSTDVDTEEKVQSVGVTHGAIIGLEKPKGKLGEQKALRRLAQNREAARKSRLRKKAYVQQLENSRVRLTQLEQELKLARQHQGAYAAASGFVGDKSHSSIGNGALAFDMEYGSWLDEHQRLVSDLRSAVLSFMGDNELRHLVDGVMSHYDDLFKIKRIGAKADVFHVLSGMWKTPAERCFMWLGGFRCSEILRILVSHLEPLTEQQLVGICNLQQSSQQAEEALSQGMEALQQLLVETLSSASLGSGNVGDFMDLMGIAMGKLATIENLLYQADLLRQQTLHRLHRILTTRQAARALLAMSDYMSRLRALSSLWLARPRS
ncbi:unnamed protein product [Cuscuta epithymum]|uniref:Uncharacterized protein n=3 Tax=Cuscuta epithymum TaxID=186058 RepID=A0AAV0DRD8_9ASTE|nr:unnamed protein product [Cuscuta epithymum]